jgi:hypothetical protein
LVLSAALDDFSADHRKSSTSLAFYDWFKYEFWRFVFVQEVVMRAAESFIEFPPMQKGASFNMESVKEQVAKAIASHSGN